MKYQGRFEQQQQEDTPIPESLVSLSLYDAPNWGWTAIGGIKNDLLPPHERARRKSTKDEYMKNKTKEKESSAAAAVVDSNDDGNIDKQKEAKDENENESKDRDKEDGGSNKNKDEKDADDTKDKNEPENNDKKKKDEKESNVKIIKVPSALLNAETKELDIYTYHRGIAGRELRNKDTGELVADVEPTDTNHRWDAPKLVADVTVRFPLLDPDYEEEEQIEKEETATNNNNDDDKKTSTSEDTKEVRASARSGRTTRRRLFHSESSMSSISSPTSTKDKLKHGNNENIPHFQQVIQWDLMNPSTPTPTLYAAQIALEYGLTFPQTIDLVQSIEQQLHNFVRSNMLYKPPVTIKDPLGKYRTHDTLDNADLSLYTDKGDGSSDNPKKSTTQKSLTRRGAASSINSRTPITPAHLLPTHGGVTLSQARPGKRSVGGFVFSVEQNYVDEVIRRAKMECKALLNRKHPETEGAGGHCTYSSMTVCHVCHARKPHIAIFPCGNVTHGLCEYHCSTRMGFHAIDLKEKPYILDYCPICCLTCVCPKCARRLDAISIEFKQQCDVQQKDITEITETNMEVLHLCSGTGKKILAELNSGGKSAGAVAGAGGTGSGKRGRRAKPPTVTPLTDSNTNKNNEDKITEILSSPSTRSSNRQIERNTRNSKHDHHLRTTPPITTTTPTATITTPTTRRKAAGVPCLKSRKTVQKIPAHEFPREMSGGTDVDPSKPNEYRTVFTSNGSFVRDDICNLPHQSTADGGGGNDAKESSTILPTTASSINDQAVEDGNVDYCHECHKSGGLVCCDKCPRAFHPRCLSIDVKALPDNYWECPGCKQDNSIQPDDRTIKGEESMDKICINLVHYDYCRDYTEKVLVLSKIHEMILRLIEFDFGYTFREPVDTKICTDYLSVVRTPMDYSTICGKLINGKYFPRMKADDSVQDDVNGESNEEVKQLTAQALDDAAFAVLKDLELVWHNCFTYNEEGSAIYRMAAVQRRKSEKIRSCCIDEFLPDNVKDRVKDYADACKKKRWKKATKEASLSSSLPPDNSLLEIAKRRMKEGDKDRTDERQKRSKGRHEIQVPYSFGGTSRTVAVFDPNTNMIVKQYTTLNGACIAAKYISEELGYASEFKVSIHNVKTNVRTSSEDPSRTLFGYRWLFVDDLRSDRVIFEDAKKDAALGASISSSLLGPEKELTLVERIHEDCEELYASIDEAFQATVVDTSEEKVMLKEFREKMEDACVGHVVELLGSKWRILQRGQERATSKSTDEGSDKAENNVSDTPKSRVSLGGNDGYFLEDGLETSFPSNIIIFKEDMLSGARLGGFESLEAAYQDWLDTCNAAIVAPKDSGDITFFREKYVNGYCSVDAIQWKPVPPLAATFNLNPAKGTKDANRTDQSNENTSNTPMSIDSKSQDIFKLDQMQTENENIDDKYSEKVISPEEEKGDGVETSGSTSKVNNKFEQDAQTTTITKELVNSNPHDHSEESLKKGCWDVNSQPGDAKLHKADDLDRTDETPGDGGAESIPIIKEKNEANKGISEVVSSTVYIEDKAETDLCSQNKDTEWQEGRVGAKGEKRPHKSGFGESMESPRKSRRRESLISRSINNNTPLTLNDEGRTAAMISATTLKSPNRTDYNYRREIVVINMNSLVIEKRYNTITAAHESANISRANLIQRMEERDACDGYLYVDGCHADSLLETMRNHALQAMQKDGGKQGTLDDA